MQERDRDTLNKKTNDLKFNYEQSLAELSDLKAKVGMLERGA